MDRETLRKVQLAQLDIAKEIRRICNENNISYFLESGTLLGAIRHSGFIPWDDDMDIGMLRKDYEKFLQIAPLKLSDKYSILDWKTNDDYGFQFCKVINNKTLYIEKKANEVGYHQGFYVDIFPYDKFPNDGRSKFFQKTTLTILRALVRNKCHVKTWETENGINYRKYFKNLPLRLFATFFSKKVLVKLYDDIAQRHNADSEYEYYFSQGIEPYGTFKFPKNVIENTEQHLFEGISFSCPFDSDSYLKYAYGNYMELPPESERENRHMIIKVKFEDEE